MPLGLLGNCPVCHCNDISRAFALADNWRGKALEYFEWECKCCGCYFINPPPTLEELSACYPENYYSYQTVNERSGGVWLKIRKGMRPLATWNYVWERLNKGNAWARTVIKGGTGSLLDVGCGSGGFLMHLRRHSPKLRLVGCDPFGPSQAQIEKSGLFEYHQKAIEDCHFQTGEFDYITLNHVLEHHANPALLLSEISRVLRPGGELYVGIPNTDGIGRRIFGSKWYGWAAPEHLVGYGIKSVTELLLKHGLRIKRVKHLSNANDLLASVNILFLGSAKFAWWKHEFTQELLESIIGPMAFCSNLVWQGDNIELICQRL